jgi:antitoxin ParD1/3/4
MVTCTVTLTETQADLIDRLVADGRYQDASEALQAGLILLEQEEADLTDLRKRLSTSLDQARRGDFAQGSGEEVIRRAFKIARAETQ